MLRRLKRDASGAVMVEFTLVAGLMLALTFGAVELGLAVFWWNMTEKATERGARLAVVRPALAAGVPESYARDPAVVPPPRFGTACTSVERPCLAVARAECVVNIADRSTTCLRADQALAIFDRMRAASPMAMRAGNPGQVAFIYEDAGGIGFVGGPYVPMVTVEVRNAQFQFVALGPFVRLLGGFGFTDLMVMPTMRTTAVGEDLNTGANG